MGVYSGRQVDNIRIPKHVHLMIFFQLNFAVLWTGEMWKILFEHDISNFPPDRKYELFWIHLKFSGYHSEKF